MPGYGELMVILVVGLIIFGRRLPEVGRSVGKTIVQFRKGLQDFKSQIDADEDFREARGALHDIKRAVDAPRTLTDPRRILRDLTDETLASPATTPAKPAAVTARPAEGTVATVPGTAAAAVPARTPAAEAATAPEVRDASPVPAPDQERNAASPGEADAPAD